jgi:hypothetical protein
LAKVWKLTESQGLRFSWHVFNVTKAVRFDVGTLNQYLLYGTTLGDFTETLTKPRVMRYRVLYSF